MPRLSKQSRKIPAVRAVWGKFIKYIRRHEARHKSIYLGCAKKIEKRVRASFRKHGCNNAKARVNAIMQSENKRCARLNAAYDRAERGRIKKLGLISGASGVTGVVFGKHDKKSSRRLRPNRN